MQGHTYPPMGSYWELTPAEQDTRLDVAMDLLNALQFWRGDPRLNSWEEGFMASLVQLLQNTHGRAKLSTKQWDKIHMILDKLADDDEAEEE